MKTTFFLIFSLFKMKTMFDVIVVLFYALRNGTWHPWTMIEYKKSCVILSLLLSRRRTRFMMYSTKPRRERYILAIFSANREKKFSFLFDI